MSARRFILNLIWEKGFRANYFAVRLRNRRTLQFVKVHIKRCHSFGRHDAIFRLSVSCVINLCGNLLPNFPASDLLEWSFPFCRERTFRSSGALFINTYIIHLKADINCT